MNFCRPLGCALGLAAALVSAVGHARPGGGGASLTPINAPTAPSNYGDGLELAPDFAIAQDGSFWAVWVSGYDWTLRGKRIGADGEVLVPEFVLVPGLRNPTLRPAVATDANGNIVVVYNGENSVVEARLFAADGVQRTTDFIDVDGDGICAGVSMPDVAMTDGGEFIVAWSMGLCDYAVDGSEVYFRRFNASGQPYSSRQIIPARQGDQSAPRIAVDSAGQFMIAWNEISPRVINGRTDVFAQAFAVTGGPIYDELTVFSGELYQYVSSVALSYERSDRVVATIAGYQETDYNIGLEEQQILVSNITATSTGNSINRVALGDLTVGDKYPAVGREDGSPVSTLVWLQIIPQVGRRLVEQEFDGVALVGSPKVLFENPNYLSTPLLSQNSRSGVRIAGWSGSGNPNDYYGLVAAYKASSSRVRCKGDYRVSPQMSVVEGGQFNVVIKRNDTTIADRLTVYSIEGTARDGVNETELLAVTDFVPFVVTLDFPVGVASRSFMTQTLEDRIAEADEYFTLRFRRSCRESGQAPQHVTVLDNEPVPEVTFEVTPDLYESGAPTQGAFRATVEQLSARPISVQLRTLGGTATQGPDAGSGDYYVQQTDPTIDTDDFLVIAPGETRSGAISVVVNPDDIAENSETILIQAESIDNGVADPAYPTGRITIWDY
jgi:hypothetical protein